MSVLILLDSHSEAHVYSFWQATHPTIWEAGPTDCLVFSINKWHGNQLTIDLSNVLISCQSIGWPLASLLWIRAGQERWCGWMWCFHWPVFVLELTYRNREKQKLIIEPTVSPPSLPLLSPPPPPPSPLQQPAPPPSHTVCPGGCTSGCCGAESLAVPPVASGRCPAGRTWRRPRRRR